MKAHDLLDAVLRISHKRLLHSNFILGLIISIANGGALLLVLTERGGPVTKSQIPEIAIWFAMGFMLIALSLAAYFGVLRLIEVLRIQAVAVLCIVIALGMWGVLLLTSRNDLSQVNWVAGYYSFLAAYSVLLIMRAYDGKIDRAVIQKLCWFVLPCAVVLDVLVAF